MPNRLADATSPYLLQHKDNPVDWYEWGADAFAAAKLTDKPILLSVGYSACHWCHVMAHESFEDPTTAAYMNANFVNVKVDREERPDVDRIYMDAVQAMTGAGGWPMTVFLTPEGRPFFAGTYFPKDPRPGLPTFPQVMQSVVDAWTRRRGELIEQAAQLTAAVRAGLPVADEEPKRASIDAAVSALAANYDWERGGIGGAPKFPQAPTLELLMRVAVLDEGETGRESRGMLSHALERMAAGGIYDHLGGGFARYSVDAGWLVPHFEKMLYDNALLARVYLRGWQISGNQDFARVARETLDYLLRDMRHREGGIFSAEDADSEGVEGKFYVWDWEELGAVLGDQRNLAAAVYGATPQGNFEGSNILHLPQPLAETAADLGLTLAELEAEKSALDKKLLAARNTRVRPGLDDKVVTSWNGFALRAFAEAAAVLGEDTYRSAALGLGGFMVDQLGGGNGLLRSWRDGRRGADGFCEDYGSAAVGLLTLYSLTGDEEWFSHGERLTEQMVRRFADPDGGFYATAADGEQLIARPKNVMDNPTPSDNSIAAEALLMLAAYTGDSALAAPLSGAIRAGTTLVERYPSAVGHLLAVHATNLAGVKEVAVVGDEGRDAMLEVVWEGFRPNCVLAAGSGGETAVPLLRDRAPGTDDARGYVCRNFVCELPAVTPEELRAQLAA